MQYLVEMNLGRLISICEQPPRISSKRMFILLVQMEIDHA